MTLLESHPSPSQGAVPVRPLRAVAASAAAVSLSAAAGAAGLAFGFLAAVGLAFAWWGHLHRR